MEPMYFDNAATTKPLQCAIDAALECMTTKYGNPSSLHLMGVESERIIKSARKTVAGRLDVSTDRLFFTSGGTESNNIAILGCASAFRTKGKIVTTTIEHKSVLNPFKYLESIGFEVVYSNVNEIEKHIDKETQLVSIMHVNNETGSIQPVDDIYRLIKKKSNAIFHVDAVQSFCKYKPPLADIVSISAHKIGGIKGTGAVYIDKKVRINPLFYGGGQESDIRVGTENVPGIAAFEAACKKNFDIDAIKQINSILRSVTGGLVLSPIDASPFILAISFEGIKSEVIIHSLEQHGLYVSSGSACSTNRPETNKVILAMGYSKSVADSTIRISFSHDSTIKQAVRAKSIIENVTKELRKVMEAKR